MSTLSPPTRGPFFSNRLLSQQALVRLGARYPTCAVLLRLQWSREKLTLFDEPVVTPWPPVRSIGLQARHDHAKPVPPNASPARTFEIDPAVAVTAEARHTTSVRRAYVPPVDANCEMTTSKTRSSPDLPI